MKRIKVNNADAILTADWHIRADTPVCRTDDYFAAMEEKVDFIFDLSVEHNCPIMIAGDLGNEPEWPNELLYWFIERLNRYERPDIIIVPGQHDLPEHRIDFWTKAGVGVLGSAKRIDMLLCGSYTFYGIWTIDAFPYGHGMCHINKSPIGRSFIAIAHQMVIDEPLWPGQKATKGHQLLEKFPEYDLILTGDNHNTFVAEHEGRLLVNPGSMMRNAADQAEHKPRVYLWCAKTNTVEPVYLPIEKGVITRAHIEAVKEKKVRREAFFTRVREDVEIGLSFESNIEERLKQQSVQKRVKEKVWEAIG